MQSLLRLFRPVARMPTDKALNYVKDKITTHKASARHAREAASAHVATRHHGFAFWA